MICEICKDDFIADGFKICIDCQQDETEKNFVQVERRDLVKWQQQLKDKSDSGNGTVFDLCIREEFFDKYLGKGG